MVRILQCVNSMDRAGLETMLMNYYRNIDRNEIQFDFLTHRPYKSDYDDEILTMGGRVYHAPRLYPQNYLKYFAYMKSFFKEHPEYKIVHSHIDSMSYLPLLAAKKAGVPVRIAHSHNTAIDKDFKYILKQYFRMKITSAANVYFACGEEAGKFLFVNKPFELIPNAIAPDNFIYNAEARKCIRAELGVENKLVIGHIGRMSYQKNHMFLIDIFKELSVMCPDAVLMLVGVGEKEQEIRQHVKTLGIDSSVRFLGKRNDAYRIYQAMDMFVLPSLFEGVPVVGIEAQFCDLPCFFSDNIPSEVKFNSKCRFIPLRAGAKYWAKQIFSACNELDTRSSLREEILNSQYDINKAKSILTDKYYKLSGVNAGKESGAYV